MIDLRQHAEVLAAARAPAAEQAEAWLAVAEAEPCFRWRLAPAGTALDRAAALLPIADRPDLDARASIRRAVIELAAEESAAARQLAEVSTMAALRAGDRVRALLGKIVATRAALRDPALAPTAAMELTELAAEIADRGDGRPGPHRLLGIELGAQLAIAFGEQKLASLELEDARSAYRQAEEILRDAPAHTLVDARFAALQGTALTAQLGGSLGRAADRLRAIIRLVSAHASPRDELEARMALGHALSVLGNHEDAIRQMDLARALASQCAGVDERMLATQSAALAALHAKEYGRALDAAFEALKLAGLEKRDLSSYIAAVSLIAQVHLSRGNPADAYLALLYASASVKQRLGARAALMLDVQIEELKRSMGADKFEAMCEAIMRARATRTRTESG